MNKEIVVKLNKWVEHVFRIKYHDKIALWWQSTDNARDMNKTRIHSYKRKEELDAEKKIKKCFQNRPVDRNK